MVKDINVDIEVDVTNPTVEVEVGHRILAAQIIEKEVEKIKFGVGIDDFMGDVSEEGVYVPPAADSLNLDFKGVKTIPESGMSYAFYRKNINSVSFPDLITVEDYGLEYAFNYGNLEGEHISFSKLENVGKYALRYCFQGTNIVSAEFPALKQIVLEGEIYHNGFSYCFSSCPNIESISFPELEEMRAGQVFSNFAAGLKSLTSISFPKLRYVSGVEYKQQSGNSTYTRYSYGPFYDFMGSGDDNITYYEFPALEESGVYGLSYVFRDNRDIVEISFPKLHTVSGMGAFYYMCDGATNLKKVSFTALKLIETGSYSNLNGHFYSAFQDCTSLETIEFPELEEIRGRSSSDNTFSFWLRNNTTVKRIDFPKLKRILKGSLYGLASSNTSGIEEVTFPMLEQITGNDTLYGAFSNNTKLTRFDFPSLTTIENNPFGRTSSYYSFRNCTGITEIHFRSDMQETISSLAGYADKWGATNATIYFDL